MDWNKMKQIEPALAELERHAEHAGRNGASWLDYLAASHEALSKLTGRGAALEELQTAQAYECARSAVFCAWCRGHAEKDPDVVPPETRHSFPWRLGFDEPCTQREMFDTSDIYQ